MFATNLNGGFSTPGQVEELRSCNIHLLIIICSRIFLVTLTPFLGPEVIAITHGCRRFRSLYFLLQFLSLHQNLQNNIDLNRAIVIVNV